MNRETISQHQIDRMVDGELESDQQRQLLLNCEEHPHAWRDLALAYVESQTLKCELKGLATEPAAGPGYQRREPRARWQLYTRSFSLAAAVLLSLALGYAGGLWWRGYRVEYPQTAEGTSSSGEFRGPTMNHAVEPSSSLIQLTVADAANNEFRQIDVPVVAAAELGPDWREQVPQAVPSEVVSKMQKLGHDVRQNRRYIPMRLQDGRRVVLPYDEIEVTFTNYQ